MWCSDIYHLLVYIPLNCKTKIRPFHQWIWGSYVLIQILILNYFDIFYISKKYLFYFWFFYERWNLKRQSEFHTITSKKKDFDPVEFCLFFIYIFQKRCSHNWTTLVKICEQCELCDAVRRVPLFTYLKSVSQK